MISVPGPPLRAFLSWAIACVVVGVVGLAGEANSEGIDEDTRGEKRAREGSPAWKAVETYLCVAEEAAGMRYVDGSGWTAGALRSRSKYLVAREKRGEINLGWRVTPFGESLVLFPSCEENSFDSGRTVACGHFLPFSVFGNFVLNRNNKRFMRVYWGTYLGGDARAGADTPYLEIGTCTALLEPEEH